MSRYWHIAHKLSVQIFIPPVSKFTCIILTKLSYNAYSYLPTSRCKKLLVTRVHIEACFNVENSLWNVLKYSVVGLYKNYFYKFQTVQNFRFTCEAVQVIIWHGKIAKISFDTWTSATSLLWRVPNGTIFPDTCAYWYWCHFTEFLVKHVAMYKRSCDTSSNVVIFENCESSEGSYCTNVSLKSVQKPDGQISYCTNFLLTIVKIAPAIVYRKCNPVTCDTGRLSKRSRDTCD